MRSEMSREDLIELVRAIVEYDFSKGSESEHTNLINKFMANVSHPEVIDVIYNREPELTPEQIVEEALTYKSIAL